MTGLDTTINFGILIVGLVIMGLEIYQIYTQRKKDNARKNYKVDTDSIKWEIE